MAAGSLQLASRNLAKPWNDSSAEAMTKQLAASEAVARQAKEELLSAYSRAEIAEQEAARHQATKKELKVSLCDLGLVLSFG